MPLTWTIDHENTIMTIVAEGDVTRADLDAMLDAMIAGDALRYRRFFEASRGDTSMTDDDVLQLGWRMRSLHRLGPMGPLAVVLPPSKMEMASRAIGMLAVADRPLRVFTGADEAHRWITRQPLPAPIE
jgi:hypothetical protein